jgi:hypothetical protein
MSEKSLNEKIAEINSLWDSEERFIMFMPNREMYCVFEEHCIIHGPNAGCRSAREEVIESICLDANTDWLQWELEMMEK